MSLFNPKAKGLNALRLESPNSLPVIESTAGGYKGPIGLNAGSKWQPGEKVIVREKGRPDRVARICECVHVEKSHALYHIRLPAIDRGAILEE